MELLTIRTSVDAIATGTRFTPRLPRLIHPTTTNFIAKNLKLEKVLISEMFKAKKSKSTKVP